MPAPKPVDSIENLFEQTRNLAKRVESLEKKAKADKEAILGILTILGGDKIGGDKR